ncbi:hypothetical protein [Mesorhizobium sp. KR9-304]|uniref:hypothetical protein n=1 Tax=Mesorhizobium sp. KR9-304 TaxID=3156614 RepID=UPI0032B55D52
MAVKTIIHCRVDQEPQKFCKGDIDNKIMSFAVNLSIDSLASGSMDAMPGDEEIARRRMARFLGAAPSMVMVVYEYRGKGEYLKRSSFPMQEIGETSHVGSPAELMQWLDEQKLAVMPGQQRFWAPARDDTTKDDGVASTSAGAGDRLRAIQSWNAPVGHGLGLTRIIRISRKFIEDYGFVALPFAKGVNPPLMLPPLTEENVGTDEWYGDLRYDLYGTGKPVLLRTTPVKLQVKPFELDLFPGADLTPEGYLRVNPHAAGVHRITRWFEEHAASMLVTANALGPRDATKTELARVERLCAFDRIYETKPNGTKVILGYHWDGAVWYGISRLIAALDNLVIAIIQPPEGSSANPEVLKGSREGDLLAPLVTLILDHLGKIEPPLSNEQLQAKNVLAAIRKVFKDKSALTRLAPAPAKAVAEALRSVHAIPQPAGEANEIVEDSDLVAELLKHFQTKPGEYVGKRLQAYAEKTFYELNPINPGDAVTRAVTEFEQRLNEDSGAEAAILRLLETVETSTSPKAHRQFADEYLTGSVDVQLAFERGWIEYRGLLEGPYNGAEAVRRASGTCFTRALLAGSGKVEGMKAADIADKIERSAYFAGRFLGPTGGCFDDLLAVLVKVDAAWRGKVAEETLRRHLVLSFADTIDQIKEVTKPRRFVPDRFPRPLPIQIGASIDGSKVDHFATALNGIGVAIRRLDGGGSDFAYAHLAELFWAWPSKPGTDPQLKVSAALHTMLPAVSDGRAPMFIEYEGYSFAESAAAERVIHNGSEVDRTKPYYVPEPHFEEGDNWAFAKLPQLAYGRRYETFAWVTSNAGTLPLELQQKLPEEPWRPRPLGDVPPAGAPVLRVPYRRTTAISDMKIAEPDGEPALFGKAIDKVHPLAHDYPRTAVFATAGNTAHCDLFRSKGGFGEIQAPANPKKSTSFDFALSDIRWGGTPKSIRIQVMDRLWAPPRLDVLVTQSPAFAITLRTIVPPLDSGVRTARFIIINGQSHSLPTELAEECWVRFVVEAQPQPDSHLCVSFAEVGGSALAGGPLLIVRPDVKDVWTQSLPTGRTVTVSTPRVTYLDFERWYANLDRRPDLPEKLRLPLSLAYMLRHTNKDLAALIDCLPDPAVQAVRIDFAMIDTYSADNPDPKSKSIMLDTWLKEFEDQEFKQSELAFRAARNVIHDTEDTPWDVEALVEVLKKLDEKFRLKIELKAGAALALSKDGPNLATAPDGSVTHLALHAHVPLKYFQRNGSHPAMLDRRLLPYANIIDKGTAVSFAGQSLRMEVMVDRIEKLVAPEAIRLAEQMIVTEPVERVRRYDLVTRNSVATDLDRSNWRVLSEIDITTQRWRPSGRPIYSYIRPKDCVDEKWRKEHKGVYFARQLAVDESLARFEHEAFFDRLHIDAHTVTQRLQPLPSRTILQQFTWEAPSATYFRHRFVLRSRYAGALREHGKRECPAWGESKKTKEPISSEWAKPWTRRVVMLADTSRVQVTRPQLRALVPLTTAPDGDARRKPAPPVAAFLQEPPFAHGGLADRIAAEIKTGFGYGFNRDQPKEGEPQEIVPVEILDSRKEAGPIPYTTYRPFDANRALGLTVIPEGPMGMTFDSVNAPAPAYPNAMFTLRPVNWNGVEGSLEELMMGVAMRRYLDPSWTIAEAVVPDKGQPLTLNPDRSWLISIDLHPESGADVDKANIIVETGEGGGGPVFLLQLIDLDGLVRVRLWKTLVDLVDTTKRSIEIARFERRHAAERGDVGASGGIELFLLHQPVAAGRYCSAVLVSPRSATLREGSSNLPVVLASFEWSLPKDMSGNTEASSKSHTATLTIDKSLKPRATETIASSQTFLRWTRTGRDFDFIHVAAQGDKGWISKVEPVSRLAASVSNTTLSIGRGRPENGVWPCSSTFTSEFPLYVHRHVAVITSRLLSELGRPVEVYARSAASGLRQPQLGAHPTSDTTLEHACRLIEYETPAAILCNHKLDTVPAIYKTAYFDLLATGFRPSTGDARLRLFFRIVAPFTHKDSLKSLTVRLGTNATKLDRFVLTRPDEQGAIVGLFVSIAKRDGRPTFEFLMATGQRVKPKSIAGNGAIPLDDPIPFRPGMYVEIEGEPGAELWTDVSLLHSTSNTSGEPFDFDWLFSPANASLPLESVSPSGLNAMVEAQARIISVSPPIRLI